MPDRRPEQAWPEPMVSRQQLAEPGDLAGRDRPHRQLAVQKATRRLPPVTYQYVQLILSAPAVHRVR
jgi:hypothetical protein